MLLSWSRSMPRTRSLSVLLAVPLAFCLLARAEEKKPSRILKLFADEFVELKPGKGKFPASFEMGSSTRTAPAAEKPAVKVTFKAPFAIAKYEVTQELYAEVTGKNASKWKGKRNSVEMVTCDDAIDVCKKVTTLMREQKLIGDREVIRLPSEAEWEYACRAGTKTAYHFGDGGEDLGEYGWYRANSAGHDPPVGKKKPNAWGLYDMHGYVWEWCSHAWSDSHKGASTDGKPRVDKEEKKRVIRGGSWADPADSARSAYRTHKPRDHKSDRIGFRCVKAKEEK